jgi:hypothetical protein
MENTSDKTTLFEVRTPDGHWYRIWPDGRVAGFGAECIVINRFNSRIADALAVHAHWHKAEGRLEVQNEMASLPRTVWPD